MKKNFVYNRCVVNFILRDTPESVYEVYDRDTNTTRRITAEDNGTIRHMHLGDVTEREIETVVMYQDAERREFAEWLAANPDCAKYTA